MRVVVKFNVNITRGRNNIWFFIPFNTQYTDIWKSLRHKYNRKHKNVLVALSQMA